MKNKLIISIFSLALLCGLTYIGYIAGIYNTNQLWVGINYLNSANEITDSLNTIELVEKGEYKKIIEAEEFSHAVQVAELFDYPQYKGSANKDIIHKAVQSLKEYQLNKRGEVDSELMSIVDAIESNP